VRAARRAGYADIVAPPMFAVVYSISLPGNSQHASLIQFSSSLGATLGS
jgi:hypothetical protein